MKIDFQSIFIYISLIDLPILKKYIYNIFSFLYDRIEYECTNQFLSDLCWQLKMKVEAFLSFLLLMGGFDPSHGIKIKTREHKLYNGVALEGTEISIPGKTAQVIENIIKILLIVNTDFPKKEDVIY